MPNITVVANSRAESSPLACVIRELPEAQVLAFIAEGQPHAEMAAALHWFTDKLRTAEARVCVVLGDRYETLAAALAATFLRIRLVHIHGGETTTGAFDDALRHSITHLTEQSNGAHCVATQAAATRVWAMTKNRMWNNDNCYITGTPGLDGVPRGSAKRDRKQVVVSFHPETMRADYGEDLCRQMLASLERFVGTGYDIIFTGVNKDPGHEIIEGLIRDYCAWAPAAARCVEMSRAAYMDLIQHAELVIGNSSSLVIETPWVGVPSVLVGDRQLGREMAASVFQNDYDVGAAIDAALAFDGDPAPVYQGGDVGEKIAKVVRSCLDA